MRKPPLLALVILVLLWAACNGVVRAPVVAVRMVPDDPSEEARVRGRCLEDAACITDRFGWFAPGNITVRLVPKLTDYVPDASQYADGYSDRNSGTIIIEASAWTSRPEVLLHELAHLSVPVTLLKVAEPLLEGLCNLPATTCAHGAAESDRVRTEAIIGILTATGGVAFDVTWVGRDGGQQRASVSFDPGEAAYLSSDQNAGTVRNSSNREILRTRCQVATFVLALLARQRGLDEAVRCVQEVALTVTESLPEMGLARLCGIGSADALRSTAVTDVDRGLLVQVGRHEAGWLYPRLRAMGIDVRQNSGDAMTKSSDHAQLCLQGSGVFVTLAELWEAPAAAR